MRQIEQKKLIKNLNVKIDNCNNYPPIPVTINSNIILSSVPNLTSNCSSAIVPTQPRKIQHMLQKP